MSAPAGYILVGGSSRRMGADKGRLPFESGTLAGHIAESLALVCHSVTLVGGGYHDFGFPVLPDAVAQFGPAAGILAALRDGPGWKLIVACDMPGVGAQLFAKLSAASDESEADCVVPVGPDGRNHPLCAAYHARALPAWESAVARKVSKVLDIVNGLNVLRISIDDPAVLRNVNTPADWQEYLDGR